MSSTIAYDPLSDEAIESPYRIYRRLSRDHPVFWHEGSRSWMVSRHASCQRILRDHRTFARDPRRAGKSLDPERETMQTQDPPHQRDMRHALVERLKARDDDAVTDAVASLADRLLGQAADGPVEFMSTVVAPLALGATADMMGIDVPELAEYHRISEGIARRMDAGIEPDAAVEGDAARRDLNRLVESWLQTPPHDGMVASLREMGASGDLDATRLRNSIGMMFNASFGTLYAGIGNIVHTIATAAEPHEVLQRSTTDVAVNELVRFDGPAQATGRYVMESCEVDGVTIAAGDTVTTLLAAANRDDTVFDRPDVLDLSRDPNPHLGFGWGPHACIGSLFGVQTIKAFLEVLAARPGPPTLHGGVRRRRTATVRSIEVLPVSVPASRHRSPDAAKEVVP